MTATNYIWDFATDSYLMEKEDGGTTTAVYTNEPVQYGKLVSQRTDNTTSYFHFDGQESTRQISDEVGDSTDERTYTAYGDAVASSGTSAFPFKFQGKWGIATDVLGPYARRRFYSPLLGRWLTADPLGFVDGMNLYVFILNRPTVFRDPSGTRLVAGNGGCRIEVYYEMEHSVPHVHVFCDGVESRVDWNGHVLTGDPPMTRKGKALYWENIRKVRTATKKLGNWRKTQRRLNAEMKRLRDLDVPDRGFARIEILVGLMASSSVLAGSSCSCEAQFDDLAEYAEHLAKSPTILNCQTFYQKLYHLLSCVGLDDEINSLLTVYNISVLCQGLKP